MKIYQMIPADSWYAVYLLDYDPADKPESPLYGPQPPEQEYFFLDKIVCWALVENYDDPDEPEIEGMMNMGDYIHPCKEVDDFHAYVFAPTPESISARQKHQWNEAAKKIWYEGVKK